MHSRNDNLPGRLVHMDSQEFIQKHAHLMRLSGSHFVELRACTNLVLKPKANGNKQYKAGHLIYCMF